MKRDAERAYPLEAAGVIIRDADGVYETIANRWEELRRDYFMIAPSLLIRSRAEGRAICAFYHSHPECSVELSDSDEHSMMAGDSPMWPGVDWVVLSVRGGQATDAAQYVWNETVADYVRVAQENVQ